MSEDVERKLELIRIHEHRLDLLRLQLARYDTGNAPTHLVLEIEEVEDEIDRLASELESKSTLLSVPIVSPSLRKRVAVRREVKRLLKELSFKAELGKWDDAVNIGERILSLDSDHPKAISETAKAYTLCGVNLSSKKSFKPALECFAKAILLDPKNAEHYYQRGLCYNHQKNNKRAIEDYKKCLEINQNHVGVYKQLGISFFQIKQYDEAVKYFNYAIPKDNMPEDLFWYRGLSHYNMQRYDFAILDFKHAIFHNPNQPEYYYFRGRSYWYSEDTDGNTDNAFTDFKKAVKLNNLKGSYHYYIGLVYYKRRKLKDSISCFNRSIELENQDGSFYLARGDAYYDLAQREKKKDKLWKYVYFMLHSIKDYWRSLRLGEQDARERLRTLPGRWSKIGYILGSKYF